MAKFLIILVALAVCSFAQRSFYLRHPVGYPEITVTTPPPPQPQQSTDDPLGNRFNDEKEEPIRNSHIPIQFQSDPASFFYYLGLPIDQRPFNVVNAAEIDDWNSKPHTYSFSPNHYALGQANIGDIQ